MPAGVYLHIPFCKSRCSYCDFATDVWRSGEAVERYVDALCDEIQNSEVVSQNSIDAIYFGGGTPSLLSAPQVGWLVESVCRVFDVEGDCEITMEMNPATVSAETLAGYRELGVNRASFGVQTFNENDLKLLARGHDASDARNTFRLLREAGFENVSFDLIAGLPGQTLADWRSNLAEAVSMFPEHLSLYLLEIHEGTPLAEQVRSNRRPVPDPELAAEMYEVMIDTLAAVGYEQYEISNFARPGFASRHNTKYWLLDAVYGFGVSAHSFDGVERYANERDTAKYVELIKSGQPSEVMREAVDVASEFIFLGLRLNAGIDLADYKTRFGVDISEKYKTDIMELLDAGLIEINETRMRLSQKGMLYSNEVFQHFV